MGMLVLSACPTTIASNIVMTRNSGGDDAAAIIEVVIGNVLGSFIAPVLIYGFIPSHAGFEQWRPASPSTLGPMYANAMKQLGLSVLVPLAVGQALRWTWSDRVEWVLQRFRLAKLCSLGLVLLIWWASRGARLPPVGVFRLICSAQVNVLVGIQDGRLLSAVEGVHGLQHPHQLGSLRIVHHGVLWCRIATQLGC